jgi:hypothetical protein
VSPLAESQERWRQIYAAAEERGGERVLVGAMLQKIDRRRIWTNVFMVSSMLLLVGMTTLFYDVLSR